MRLVEEYTYMISFYSRTYFNHIVYSISILINVNRSVNYIQVRLPASPTYTGRSDSTYTAAGLRIMSNFKLKLFSIDGHGEIEIKLDQHIVCASILTAILRAIIIN